MIKSAATVFVTLIACGTLSSCGASAVTASDVEDQIVTQLTDADGNKPDSASCPDDLPAEVGETMECTVTAGDQEIKVEVKVTKVDGNDVNFDISPVE